MTRIQNGGTRSACGAVVGRWRLVACRFLARFLNWALDVERWTLKSFRLDYHLAERTNSDYEYEHD